MSAHVLMLSSSRVDNDDYLAHTLPFVHQHLHSDITGIIFVPYAGVTMDWDSYTEKVQTAFSQYQIQGLHTFANPEQAITRAKDDGKAILVGGGNTFNLLTTLYNKALVAPFRQAVSDGVPYIGWSAGSNICGATIRTTNDMPIIEPPSFDALGILPCQLNPHYSDYHPPGFNGETRDQRLAEFTALNPLTPVLAIREGTALRLSKNRLTLLGERGGFVFKGMEKTAIGDQQDLTEFLN